MTRPHKDHHHPVLTLLASIVLVIVGLRIAAHAQASMGAGELGKLRKIWRRPNADESPAEAQATAEFLNVDPNEDLFIGSVAPASNDDYSDYDATLAGSFPASDPPGNY
jgi:hypothetical protein